MMIPATYYLHQPIAGAQEADYPDESIVKIGELYAFDTRTGKYIDRRKVLTATITTPRLTARITK